MCLSLKCARACTWNVRALDWNARAVHIVFVWEFIGLQQQTATTKQNEEEQDK